MFQNLYPLQLIPEIPDRIIDLATITEVIGSLILSTLLVLLYWKMQQIEREQTDIQDSQKELMAQQNTVMTASFKPDVYARLHDLNGDTVNISVLNRGRGRAKNIRILCQTYYNVYDDSNQNNVIPTWRSQQGQLTPVMNDCDFIPQWGEEPVSHGDAEKRIQFGGESESSQSDIYQTEVYLRSGSGKQPFSDAVEGIDGDICFELYLVYDNEIGDRFIQRVVAIDNIQFDQPLSLEQAVSSGSEVDSLLSRTDE